ncbi:MAG: hypothetical protein HFI70_06305 [Lachnospiraceae bacterium]|nr:hypothetical protein [Lachnospiraceae bacterium]
MKKYIVVVLALLLSLVFSACENETESRENKSTVQNKEVFQTEGSPETESERDLSHKEETEESKVAGNQIDIKVGESTLTADLEDNESAKALKELLEEGPLTIPASDYGGFEKVCTLGSKLPSNDSQTTTNAGDICLYNGSQIVIFYGSNSWAYTKLGKIPDVEKEELERILSGKETEITLSLKP